MSKAPENSKSHPHDNFTIPAMVFWSPLKGIKLKKFSDLAFIANNVIAKRNNKIIARMRVSFTLLNSILASATHDTDHTIMAMA